MLLSSTDPTDKVQSYSFFEKKLIQLVGGAKTQKGPSTTVTILPQVFQNPAAALKVTCSTILYGGVLIAGDSEGRICSADTKNYRYSEVKAFSRRVTALKALDQELFMAIGEDFDSDMMAAQSVDGDFSIAAQTASFNNPSQLRLRSVVKIFGIDSSEKRIIEKPRYEFDLLPDILTEPVDILCMDFNEAKNLMAIGLGKNAKYFGNVAIFKGDVLKGKCRFSQTYEISTNTAVSGLGFAIGKDGNPVLFVASGNSVTKFTITGRGEFLRTEFKREGCPEKCATILDRSQAKFITVSNNKILTFTDKSEEPVVDKRFSFEPIRNTHFNSTGSNFAVIVSQMPDSTLQYLTIFDLENSFKAYEQSQGEVKIVDILNDFGQLHLLVTSENRPLSLFRFDEKPIQTKLDMIMKKFDFELAIRLAKSSNPSDTTFEPETRVKYADHLFSQGKYELAVGQYKRTIGFLEPSYVIRKFLDSQRNDMLINYLEELHLEHNKNYRSKDHTTLLLNCYVRLRDMMEYSNKTSELDVVAEKFSSFFDKNAAIDYDRETAIRVLRDAGYREKALELARRFQIHDWIVKILMLDYPQHLAEENIRVALQYIETLDVTLADNFIKIYGKTLVNILPIQTTHLLIRMCTYHRPLNQEESNADRILPGVENFPDLSLIAKSTKCNSDDYIFCFADDDYWLMVFLENVVYRLNEAYVDKSQLSISSLVLITLLELYLNFWEATEATQLPQQQQQQQQFIESYESMFIQLGSVAASENPLPRNTNPRYQIDLPLRMFKEMTFREKILHLLENFESYDNHAALILVQSKKFNEGILYLYDRLGLYHDILHHHMDERNFDAIIQFLLKHLNDQNMWIHALKFFTDPRNPAPHQKTDDLLKCIKDKEVIPPLIVVQILTLNPDTKLGLIKNYLLDKLQVEQDDTQECINRIKNYQADSKKLLEEVNELRSSAKIFQLTTCTACSEPLDLPAIHFMCMHSYHLRCLADREECFKCSKKNKDAVTALNRLGKENKKADMFHKMVNDPKSGGFDAIALFFGRNLFQQNNFVDSTGIAFEDEK